MDNIEFKKFSEIGNHSRWLCIDNKESEYILLGEISFYTNVQKYVFYPSLNKFFNSDQLEEIKTFMQTLNEEIS